MNADLSSAINYEISVFGSNRMIIYLADYQPDEVFYLPENLVLDEENKLINHLVKLGYVELGTLPGLEKIKSYKGSLFALIYDLVFPARPRLEEIVRDFFYSCLPIIQKLIQAVTLFHQFGRGIPKSSLYLLYKENADDNSYQGFQRLLDKYTYQILFIETSRSDCDFIRLHHRIIAEIISAEIFNDPRIALNFLIELIDLTQPSQVDQRESLEYLLINTIGREGYFNSKIRFKKDQIIEIFTKAAKSLGTRAIIHHLARVHLFHNNIDEALINIDIAINTPPILTEEGGRFEQDQFMLVTKGRILADRAMRLMKSGNFGKAESDFFNAERIFQLARTKYANTHSYHAHANMEYHWARLLDDPIEKNHHLSKAHEIISESLEIINPHEKDFFIKLYSQIMAETKFKNFDELQSMARDVSERYGSPNGYFSAAKTILNVEEEKEFLDPLKLQESEFLIEEGLKNYPRDVSLLSLKAKMAVDKIIKIPDDDMFKILELWWHNLTDHQRNYRLQLEYGRVLWLKGMYKKALMIFKNLNIITQNFNFQARVRIVARATDKYGNQLRFTGKVIQIDKWRADRGYVKCHAPHGEAPPVRFITDERLGLGDRISFYIGFNYINPIAYKLAKLS